MSLISLIVSVYNEEEGLGSFYSVTRRVMDECMAASGEDLRFELLFVNDGSTDRSPEILDDLMMSDSSVKVIEFSRNFGHEAAMTAGLDHAEGDILIFMDADLQHPPECIPAIIDSFREGYEIVTMIRTRNDDAGLVKRITSAGFYKVINALSPAKLEPGASDFFAIGKRPAEVLRNNYREKVRFLRGYVQNIGFRKTGIDYEAGRRVAGSSHYSIKKLWKFSMDTIMCFSDGPLKAGTFAGAASFAAALVILVSDIAGAVINNAGIMILLLVLFGILFFLTGILGSYIAGMSAQLRDRPIYIISDIKHKQGE